MSRPNDSPSTPFGDQPSESQGAKKKRKISRVRLPTPPPDPTAHAPVTRKTSRSDKDSDGSSTRKSSRNERETEFFDYLESLPDGNALSRSTSTFAPAIATDDAFDHLEKLYKLMEQMLQLREQNARLHRRVRDLEHLRNLQDMHRMLDEQQINLDELPPTTFDQDSIYAENLLENILKKSSKQSRFRQSILRKSQRHYRSTSTAFDKDAEGVDKVVNIIGRRSDKKVSKWTKVKAAFKWEKASSTVSDAKSQDSGLSGMIPVNYEVARYLRVPSTSDDVGISPGDSGAAEASTPGTVSSASSNEDIHRNNQLRRKNLGYTSDEDQIFAFDSVSMNRDDQKTLTNKCQPHRTPWAKMKGIINTRTSIKKQHRLSTRSDDFKIDDSICSENEDVFDSEDSPKSPVLIIQSPEEVLHETIAGSKIHNIPLEIIGRYHQLLAEDEMKEIHERHRSKWNKVKQAFLSSSNINRIEDTYSLPPIKKDSNTSYNDVQVHDEIQENYFQLQQKLSLEFRDKLREWERNKHCAASILSTNNPGTVNEECRDPVFKKKMEEWEKIKGLSKPTTPTSPVPQMTSEQNLPPEFRKKLEEWKRIKKTSKEENNALNAVGTKKKLSEWPKWKSISSRTETDTTQNSDSFMRKLEEWKHIKNANNEEDFNKTKGNRIPSPLIGRQESSIKDNKRIRDRTEKELQWFEKELSKIDREKQRLERDRQKFLEGDERITKLRKTIAGNNLKKDILVHTPSGYYRFEGISRKFTQKLYEWEKAQGIGPESSTFALLSSSNIPHIRSPSTGNEHRSSLVRSKSADSVINSESNPPILSPQPSSLSLNDVDNLEKEVMLGGIDDPISDTLDNIDEPEALIVEVEDIEEETAAPLESLMKKHTPIYHRQDNNLCEGKAKAAPTVRRSKSTKAQANYNLIEDILNILKYMAVVQDKIETVNDCSDAKSNNKEDLDVQLMKLANQLSEKVISLQEANSILTLDPVNENTKYKSVTDVLESITDLTNKSHHLAQSINGDIRKMLDERTGKFTLNHHQYIFTPNLQYFNNLILDIRRKLSYICAACDMTVPSHKNQSIRRTSLKKSSSYDKEKIITSRTKDQENPLDILKSTDKGTTSKIQKYSPKSEHIIKSEQGAIKKRLKYRQKGSNNRTLDDSDEDDDKETLLEQRKNKPRRGIRSQNSSDSNKSSNDKLHKEPKVEENTLVVDPKLVEKIVVPTETGFVNIENQHQANTIPEDTPVTIFVKTTRKLFTPIIAALNEERQSFNQKLLTPPDTPIPTRKKLFRSKTDELAPKFEAISHLPPLPGSPTPQRKTPKEISPNIRMMLVRYNQKLNEESLINNKSGGSSGSASPIAWRSPVLERRVRAQTEKYQMEIQKLSPLLGGRREVQKSASVGVIYTGSKQVTVHEECKQADLTKGILKSSSISVIRNDEKISAIPETPIEPIPSCATVIINTSRSDKLQKAKEEFLNAPLVPERNSSIQNRNRLSQISVVSDASDSSSYNMLVKSASAGMINIDPTYYKQFEPEMHSDGYVSLPRSSKGLLSNITSKFRKVKMRRGKEHHNQQVNRMNTISQLCRQSLLVDINTNVPGAMGASSGGSQETLALPESNRSSGQSSPAASGSGSWIRKPKLFKSNK